MFLIIILISTCNILPINDTDSLYLTFYTRVKLWDDNQDLVLVRGATEWYQMYRVVLSLLDNTYSILLLVKQCIIVYGWYFRAFKPAFQPEATHDNYVATYIHNLTKYYSIKNSNKIYFWQWVKSKVRDLLSNANSFQCDIPRSSFHMLRIPELGGAVGRRFFDRKLLPPRRLEFEKNLKYSMKAGRS